MEIASWYGKMDPKKSLKDLFELWQQNPGKS